MPDASIIRCPGLRWKVFQTRFHGRGGRGVVTAAELLSVAAFRAGRHAQAFPPVSDPNARGAGCLLLPDRRPTDPFPGTRRRA